MKYSYRNRTICLYIILLQIFACSTIYSQDAIKGNVEIRIEETNYSHQNIIGAVVRIVNNSDQVFSGSLAIKKNKGLRRISGNKIKINITPQDSIFIPVKFLISPDAEAGETVVTYSLLDTNDNLITSNNVSYYIKERDQLSLSIQNSNIFVTNSNDSIRIHATIDNKGNKAQDVAVIFSIPTLSGEKNFIEQKAKVDPMEKHSFSFSFIAPKGLLEQQQFQVNIFALKGRDKEMFGSSIVMVQNVSSNRRYNDLQYRLSDVYSTYSRNYITTSYRQIGADYNIMQLQGGGSINLPAGSLELKGNIYKYNSQSTPVATNTSLTYRLYEHEFMVGNMSESFELTMFGRGTKFVTANKEQTKNIEFGFVDNNFNLFGSSPFFKNGYSIYGIGRIGMRNMYRNLNTIFIYQDDPTEKAKNKIVGSEMRFGLNSAWIFDLKVHGASTHFEQTNKEKVSGSAELQYRGTIGDLSTTGTYYHSSGYFPGNRRGVLSLSQTVNKPVDKVLLRSNLSYFDYSPRSYTYNITSHSKNIKGDIGVVLSQMKPFTPSLSYQFQSESTNSYRFYFSQSYKPEVSMVANRIAGQLSWSSPNLKHLILTSVESGVVRYPGENKLNFQLRTNASYSYKWINLNAVYQQGSYYISEYVLSQENNKVLRRFMLSSAISKNFAKNKYTLNAGQTLMYDIVSGVTPSAFVNIKYNPSNKYSLYLNSSWYRYSFSNIVNNVFNVEVGLTVNFANSVASSRKKSKVIASVYYDHNANKKFDEGDEPAPDYDILIDKTPFVSDAKGKFYYSSVPYGRYEIKSASKGGWFYNGQDIEVKKYKTHVEIPLQQAGTLSGKIEYLYDKKKTLDIELKYGGLGFSIMNSSKVVIQNVVTDNDGNFTVFLPTGDYYIEMNQNTLEVNTSCSNPNQSFTVVAGKITNLPHFKIEVKQKKINIKRFSQ